MVKRVICSISICVICSLTLTASSFTFDSFVGFTPLAGIVPGPAADSDRFAQISATPGSYPPNLFLSSIGVPLSGEQNSLQNGFNSSQYSVNAVVALPTSIGYGFSATGILSDPANTIFGFGPEVDTEANFYSSAVFAGTVNMALDCQISSSDPTQGAGCGISAQLYSRHNNTGPDDFYIATESDALSVRGNGQAGWDGNQITASGTDYTLEIVYGTSIPASTCICALITVQNGVVVSIVQHTSLSLPSVGSSGSFSISAPIQPVSYDFRSAIGQSPTQLLALTASGYAIGGTGIAGPPPPPPVPESSSCLLVGAGLGALVLGRRKDWSFGGPAPGPRIAAGYQSASPQPALPPLAVCA